MTAAGTSPQRTAPTKRWEKRYREVMDAYAVQFADKGYAGASMRDIAQALGVQQASLYYYFESKDAALAAICEAGVLRFIDELRAIVGSSAPAAHKLRAAIENHLSPLRSRPYGDYVRVFLLYRHELPNGPNQRVATLARTYQLLIEKLFEDGREDGEFRSDLDAANTALAFLGLCNSVITARKPPRRPRLEAIISDYAGILLNGVVATSRAGRPSLRANSIPEARVPPIRSRRRPA